MFYTAMSKAQRFPFQLPEEGLAYRLYRCINFQRYRSSLQGPYKVPDLYYVITRTLRAHASCCLHFSLQVFNQTLTEHIQAMRCQQRNGVQIGIHRDSEVPTRGGLRGGTF